MIVCLHAEPLALSPDQLVSVLRAKMGLLNSGWQGLSVPFPSPPWPFLSSKAATKASSFDSNFSTELMFCFGALGLLFLIGSGTIHCRRAWTQRSQPSSGLSSFRLHRSFSSLQYIQALNRLGVLTNDPGCRFCSTQSPDILLLLTAHGTSVLTSHSAFLVGLRKDSASFPPYKVTAKRGRSVLKLCESASRHLAWCRIPIGCVPTCGIHVARSITILIPGFQQFYMVEE